MFVNLDACMASQVVTLAVHTKLQARTVPASTPPATARPPYRRAHRARGLPWVAALSMASRRPP